jgi:hypothetical protein
MGESDGRSQWRPVHENLLRAMPAIMDGERLYEVRGSEDEPPVLTGHFSVFDTWTTIESRFEGRFRERIAPGSFRKTFAENRDRIRVLFQHGKDPELGERPIALPEELREDEVGAYYEAPLFEGIPPLIVDGLRKGAYDSSFRFRVTREEVERSPKASDANPDGLPERTIREVELHEFGPVTFGAYPTASAMIRSLTDDYLRALLTEPVAPSDDAGVDPHLEPERREPLIVPPAIVAASPRRFRSDADWFAFTKEFRR